MSDKNNVHPEMSSGGELQAAAPKVRSSVELISPAFNREMIRLFAKDSRESQGWRKTARKTG
jgi:hypothetical protein